MWLYWSRGQRRLHGSDWRACQVEVLARGASAGLIRCVILERRLICVRSLPGVYSNRTPQWIQPYALISGSQNLQASFEPHLGHWRVPGYIVLSTYLLSRAFDYLSCNRDWLAKELTHPDCCAPHPFVEANLRSIPELPHGLFNVGHQSHPLFALTLL